MYYYYFFLTIFSVTDMDTPPGEITLVWQYLSPFSLWNVGGVLLVKTRICFALWRAKFSLRVTYFWKGSLVLWRKNHFLWKRESPAKGTISVQGRLLWNGQYVSCMSYGASLKRMNLLSVESKFFPLRLVPIRKRYSPARESDTINCYKFSPL